MSLEGEGGARIGQIRAPRNRTPAQIQITAEQIIREAQDYREDSFEETRQHITDEAELLDYRKIKRTSFEDAVRRNRYNIGAWVNYARWEVTQKDFVRARSIFERALEIEPTNGHLWIKYAEMETEQGFLNYARNIYERATSILPRFDALWFNWAYVEEKIGNVPGARNVFQRFSEWRPNIIAWETYINFEIRHQNLEGARSVYENFLVCHPTVNTYIKYAKFESKHSQPLRSRVIYERALIELEEDANHVELFTAFAEFEEYQREYERARNIYKIGLERVPKVVAHQLFERFTQFEKQRGTTESIDDVVAAKKRLEYEEIIGKNPLDYDTWFDYIRLEEHTAGRLLEKALESTNVTSKLSSTLLSLTSMDGSISHNMDDDTMNDAIHASTSNDLVSIPLSVRDNIHNRVRSIYNRAVEHKPPSQTIKQHWRRYIYLWLKFAVYEELFGCDIERAREIYARCLAIIPHKHLTFSKIWILAAELEIRRGDIQAARKLLGLSLGKCPRMKVLTMYISLESELGNIDRCRMLFQKSVELFPQSAENWISFATFESNLSEIVRARAVYEIALQETTIDSILNIWLQYINMEKSQNNIEHTRKLYKRLLQSIPTLSNWLDFIKFEISPACNNITNARQLFIDADTQMKQAISVASQKNVSTMVQAAQATNTQAAAANPFLDTAKQVASVTSAASMESLSALIEAKETRASLLQSWREFEHQYGTPAQLTLVTNKLPTKSKKTHILTNEFGAQTGAREYFDYIFPDDRETGQSSQKLLAMSRKWKMKKMEMEKEKEKEKE